MVSGSVVGGGADLTVPEMGCTEEYDWFDPVGEDTVVAVNGLTVGQRYGVTLQSASDDLSVYITSACPPATGMVTACSSFTDTAFPFFTNAPEVITFTATATTHFIVVDTSATGMNVEDGDFTLEVTNATCGPQTEATDCQQGTPYCIDFACKQCVSGFDCQSGTPSCDAQNTCVAAPAQCTGDDAGDDGDSDDGPSVATVITAPTSTNTPTVVTAAICSTPATEEDWYRIALTDDVSVSLTFTGAANDLDVYLFDESGEIVTGGAENAGINEAFLTEDIEPGTYYLLVYQYAPTATAAATSYTLTVALPECDPSEFPFASCPTAAEPVCGPAGTCGTGPARCTGDTAGEPNDDGPAGGRTLTAANITGQICNGDDEEKDFYRFNITTAGSGETINLAWADTTIDLDLYVLDSQGRVIGESFYGTGSEQVVLTNLATGNYFARVEAFVPSGGSSSLAATTYTINATTTAVTTCTGARTCGTEYKTQLYRGQCNVNVCSFIEGAGAVAQGGACDSTDDCMGGRCSYVPFESDAQKSVCGPMSCTADAMCTAVNADLRCTTGFQTNFCQPSCTTDLNCGAQVSSATLDPGQPWNYFTCTTATGACSAQ